MKSSLLCPVTLLFLLSNKTHNSPLFVKQIVKFIFVLTQNKKDTANLCSLQNSLRPQKEYETVLS